MPITTERTAKRTPNSTAKIPGDRHLSEAGLDLLFREARTYSTWLNKPVPDETLRALYDLMKMGPTSANCSPARIVFVRTPEAKERLLTAMNAGNVEKTRSAPVTAIIGYDMKFYEKLSKLFPHTDARSWFVDNPELIFNTAFRNSSLQGGYFMMAARSLGLDCGPMSGFDAEKVDHLFFSRGHYDSATQEHFPESHIRTNFICNLGYGDPSKLHPRSPRLSFREACQLI